MNAQLLSPDELDGALRQIGAERYHSQHPFHKLMYQGKLNRGQLQAWALNRYYYQCRIPAKDATLIARLPTPELRRAWRRRLHDHDGDAPNTGGIERWLRLTDGLGLDREYVMSTEGLLPITRFAVDAYVPSASEACWRTMDSLRRIPSVISRRGWIRRRWMLNSLLPTSRSTLARWNSNRQCWRCCAPSVIYFGPCSMHCISLMWSLE
jgi:coenzyme PQQ biosynthesis protein C